MNYCSQCGARVQCIIPAGDDRQRFVCTSCGCIHYQNPKTVVGCIIEHDGKVLLCQRAIEPRTGFWTPPAGYLELHESATEGALRETWEEARARVEIVGPHAYVDITHIGQSYLLYRARLLHTDFAPGPESRAVQLFDLADIPWDRIAFPVLHLALELLAHDRRRGDHSLHFASLVWSGNDSRYDPTNYVLKDHFRLPLRTGP